MTAFVGMYYCHVCLDFFVVKVGPEIFKKDRKSNELKQINLQDVATLPLDS